MSRAEEIRQQYPPGAHRIGSDGHCVICDLPWPCDWSLAFTDIHELADLATGQSTQTGTT